eukprot:TRINITY_DN30849_c0_g1_i1.p1 TRINITY_DN30849_c0_g1~~TRINITY_DN30849_c0_g1_i1.p1  ORF type:complete len:685 (+),score=93.29 TRINITY_DN30849_c0_g1_i1:157-2211(+)
MQSAEGGPVPPPGLSLGKIDEACVSAAIRDVERVLDQHVPSRRNPTSSDMAEVGYSFTEAFRDGGSAALMPAKTSLEDVPNLQVLLEATMAAAPWRGMVGSEALRDEGLNVILRRYKAGQRLGFHKDAIGLFEEPIWGCVLKSAGQGLKLRRCGSKRCAPEPYCLQEHPGLVFLLTGEARYDWTHGVDEHSAGPEEEVRMSVTLRWFRKDSLQWHRADVAERRLWTAAFIAALNECKTEEWQILDFITLWDQRPNWWSYNRLFAGKNDACGPQLQEEDATCALRDGTVLAEHRVDNAESGECVAVLYKKLLESVEYKNLEHETSLTGIKRVLQLQALWAACGSLLKSLVSSPTEAVKAVLDRCDVSLILKPSVRYLEESAQLESEGSHMTRWESRNRSRMRSRSGHLIRRRTESRSCSTGGRTESRARLRQSSRGRHWNRSRSRSRRKSRSYGIDRRRDSRSCSERRGMTLELRPAAARRRDDNSQERQSESSMESYRKQEGSADHHRHDSREKASRSMPHNASQNRRRMDSSSCSSSPDRSCRARMPSDASFVYMQWVQQAQAYWNAQNAMASAMWQSHSCYNFNGGGEYSKHAKSYSRQRRRDTADSAGTLRRGTQVTIHGLEKAPHLNGKVGKLLDSDADTVRWLVQLDDGEVKAVKPTNCELLSAGTNLSASETEVEERN